jgi:hypothetical protein
LFSVNDAKAGSKVTELKKQAITPRFTKRARLESPLWLTRNRIEKPMAVVNEVKKIARPVDETLSAMSGAPSSQRCRI